MSHVQASSRQNCCLLAVLCGKFADRPRQEADGKPSYLFPQLVSSGRLEVHPLVNPNIDKFRDAQKLLEPNFLYCRGEQLEYEDEIGSFVLGDTDVSDPEMFSSLMDPPLPTIVYLEVPNSEKVAQALRSKGVPYVIYWKNPISTYAASHFRQALLSVIQSSCCHTWDAFQLANASFRLYYAQNNHVSPGQQASSKLGPYLLGDAPRVNIILPEKDPNEEEERSSDDLPAIKIYDEDVDVKFLICGVPCALDAFLLGSLEDGLNALLDIEIRGSKLRNRVSAAPPPLEAGTFSSDVVTMRCDLTTCSYAHISLLVSRSSQTCFSDQVLERHIKKELIEKNQLVHALPNCQESRPTLTEPCNSEAIAYGASAFEVCMKVPTWASQVLRQLAPQVCFRSLVTLGISSIQGTSVASFEKEDADRLLFFCTGQGNDLYACTDDSYLFGLPRWACSLHKGSLRPDLDTKQIACCKFDGENGNSSEEVREDDKKLKWLIEGTHVSTLPSRLKSKTAALRPIPHLHQHKMLPFLGTAEADSYNGNLLKHTVPIIPSGKHKLVPAAPTTQRKSISSSLQAQQIISLNPLPMKKHGCDRCPIQVCSEEEFLKDVMQFLILRGHGRLVPQGGISEFPDAILNAKRLDLLSLYREVVSRGGFYVGNGINWKGQVFSKMRNHTTTNKMTGVGNTLKRHYETYLLEYELAHDDVDGECCLLCHSSAPGDWVNCGLCGEWAHFGCDRRPGLGPFKDYAKTDGLEYVCPHCSLTNCKRKQQKLTNGFSNTSTAARHL